MDKVRETFVPHIQKLGKVGKEGKKEVKGRNSLHMGVHANE